MDLKELFPYVAGVILSLLLTYFPKLKDWYANQTGRKALIVIGLTFLVSLAYFGLACVPSIAARLGIAVACTADGALDVLFAFGSALVASQATYLLTKQN